MNKIIRACSSGLLPLVVLIHLYWSPYTKVEESFNIQAIHDITVSGIPTRNVTEYFAANYDHVLFPGPIPRSFVGALVLAGISQPCLRWITSIDQLQLLVRAILGVSNACSMISLKNAIEFTFGQTAGVWYVLLQASQFHVMYYASRTLPNMYAFGITTLALRSLIIANSSTVSASVSNRQYRLCLYLITVAGIIFRSELAILLGCITLYLLSQGRVSIPRVIIPAGIAGSIIGLASTVLIDSFFWQKFPLWPEWSAFYFNTIQGHASDWGVSPWWFYFANSIPRLLLNPIVGPILLPAALLNPATRHQGLNLLVPLFFFTAIYSFLPHKEWRFILYIIPGITGVAAAGAAWIWNRRTKSYIYSLLSLCLVGSVAISFVASFGIMAISSLNYPGGVALTRFHALTSELRHPVVRVHLDNLSCQTGVTRFLQKHNNSDISTLPVHKGDLQTVWLYDKTEDMARLLDPVFWKKFDFVLAESPEKVIGKWEIVETIYGFGGVRIVRPNEEIKPPSEVPPLSERSIVMDGTIGKLWQEITVFVRRNVSRGWWIDLKMVPKINILRNPDRIVALKQ